VASELLTLDMLHCWLGHIAPGAAQKLVRDGLVTGLKLDDGGHTDFFCESCTYGKMTRVPILKVREGEGAKALGEEVHSDVWGPARVATKKGSITMLRLSMIFCAGLMLISLQTSRRSPNPTKTLTWVSKHSLEPTSKHCTLTREGSTWQTSFSHTSNHMVQSKNSPFTTPHSIMASWNGEIALYLSAPGHYYM
jgi:hypothetical protein